MQIVAPAGNFACLKAAVNNGADAVYLGMPRFGARAKADNFGGDELKKAIDFAHLFGTKVFVTLNTLIKDNEMNDALDAANFAYECGADAAIVQDIRYIRALKKTLPLFTLHASTQMGVHNEEGAKAILDMGIKRAVLSRETLPCDIEKIKSTGLDIEFFVQGALCVCFSGNCYFSSLASSYSGNRGKCMQLCRKPYTFGKEKGYFLSAKDLCLYDKLSALEELDVDAIKIEGRMRSEEYVAQAVRVYKSNMPPIEAKKALSSVYNRGDYCSAYLDEGAQFNVIYPSSQSNIGRSIGKVERISGKKLFVNGYSPYKNDGFKIMRGGKEICGAAANNGEIHSDGACRVGDEVRLTFDGKLSESLKAISRKIDIEVHAKFSAGIAPEVVVEASSKRITVTGEFAPQTAKSSPLSTDDVKKAFLKVAELPFDPHVTVELDGDLFMPVSELNALRRKAYDAMYNALTVPPTRSEQPPFSISYNKFNGHGNIVQVESLDCITAEVENFADYIALSPADYAAVPAMKVKTNKPVLLSLPVTMRGADREIVKRAIDCDFIYGVISNNYYSLKITDKPILLGTGHNIIGECDLPHITSFEADRIDKNAFTYVFGYAPLMTLCHCPYGKCINCGGKDELIDEKGRRFALKRYKAAHCYWQLLNCVPIVSDNAENINNRFYDFVGLNTTEIANVIRGGYRGEFTRGNVNKGLK